MRSFLTLFASLCLLPAALLAQRHAPPPPQVPSPEAAAWWAQTTALANDSMEGRDTGTEAYERAAKYVADQFAAAGLKPAGDNGTFFQRVPMHQIDLDLRPLLDRDRLPRPAAIRSSPSTSLEEVTLTPRRRLSTTLDAPMVFLGYGLPLPQLRSATSPPSKASSPSSSTTPPPTLPAAERATFTARRNRALADAGVAAILSIDNPAAIEPFHWPAAYARAVTLAGAPEPTSGRSSPSPHQRRRRTPPLHRRPQPIPSPLSSTTAKPALPFPPSASTPASASASPPPRKTSPPPTSSPSFPAPTPPSPPSTSPSPPTSTATAIGTPVLGDNLYNGALDDAAYVATLLELAKRRPLSRPQNAPARSLLFCIFTGEEKGLLGSAYFTHHPTVPVANIVANLNLDQLRPIFPLKILTMEGIDDSTLGDTARTVAAQFSIETPPRPRARTQPLPPRRQLQLRPHRRPHRLLHLRLQPRLTRRGHLPRLVRPPLPQAAGRPRHPHRLESRRHLQRLL